MPEESASAGSNVKEVAPKKASVQIKKTTADKKPVFMNMIIEAITENGDKKGTSVPAIKTYMQNKYSVGEVGRMALTEYQYLHNNCYKIRMLCYQSSLKANLKKNILKAIESDIIYRANSSKDSKGCFLRFLMIVGRWCKQVQLRSLNQCASNQIVFNVLKNNKCKQCIAGLRGRFKVNPEYLKTKRKEEKEKQKKASMAAKKSALAKGRKKAVKKPRTVSVNGKELKSLGEKSYTVKVVQKKFEYIVCLLRTNNGV